MVRVFSWVSRDTGKRFPLWSLMISIVSAWDFGSTMSRPDLSGRV